MPSAFVLLQCIGKAAVKNIVNLVSFGIGGDILVDAWVYWRKATREEQRAAEVQDVAQMSAAELRVEVARIVREEGGALNAEQQAQVASYLSHVPAMVRRSLRRPSDQMGTTTAAGASFGKPEALLPLLPCALPRFKVGDRPVGIGDWELMELLGVGGFGEVWKACNPHFDGIAPVALKFCLEAEARRHLALAQDRLMHEAKILNEVMKQGKHDGIVPLLHTYLNADPPCLAYEYIDGGDLAGLIQERQDGLPADQAARWIKRLADIVGIAHRLSPPIVHRDLKPANILLKLQPVGEPALRITDFGIGGLSIQEAIDQARRGSKSGESLTAALRGAYSPLYASRQQMRGDKPDPRDDVYALGVIWYQMLTGDLTKGCPGGEAWRKRLADRGMSPAMLALLVSSCEDEREDRPNNAMVLAEKLDGLLHQDAPTPVLEPIPKLIPGFETLSLEKSDLESSQIVQPRTVERNWPLTADGSNLTNSIGTRFIWIPPGTFEMGSPLSEQSRRVNENKHMVVLTKGMYLGIHEVTQSQWRAVMSNNPSLFKGNDLPVEQVSWKACQKFCMKLSELDGKRYRLPTEAEWEYACRAGTTTPFHFGETINTEQANYNGDYTYNRGRKGVHRQQTTPVGTFPPNGWGLFDMHGNVYEWCGDGDELYPQGDACVTDPQSRSDACRRALRGGSWFGYPDRCRSAYRRFCVPDHIKYDIGLRVVLCLD